MTEELFDTPVNGSAPRVLPRARRERWQPLRSGVLNIFKYDEEEFPFEDGRLLLRGNNGAGKSRVLALQLPFLLDGSMDSHRVEPDGDPAKRMEWNLLMNRHENRLGYTWIEFGRRDADGVEHFLTLGCGMHARKGVGIPPNARWFFITSQRIGEALQLMSGNRVPLNRERLEAAIGRTSVYRTAAEYRAAVDDALFGLGTRYGPLIELLLQLRKPQIMRDFKADDLSRLLSEALPPLSQRLIENVSVSFRSLETDRQQLTELTEARISVETFLKTYRQYVRIAVRRRAADVRGAHSRFESAQREIKRLADQRGQNDVALAAAQGEEQCVDVALAGSREAERTLLASPEMKSAENLRHAAETRDERSGRVVEAEENWRRSHAARDQRGGEKKEAGELAAKENAAVTGHLTRWHLPGRRLGCLTRGFRPPAMPARTCAARSKGRSRSAGGRSRSCDNTMTISRGPWSGGSRRKPGLNSGATTWCDAGRRRRRSKPGVRGCSRRFRHSFTNGKIRWKSCSSRKEKTGESCWKAGLKHPTRPLPWRYGSGLPINPRPNGSRTSAAGRTARWPNKSRPGRRSPTNSRCFAPGASPNLPRRTRGRPVHASIVLELRCGNSAAFAMRSLRRIVPGSRQRLNPPACSMPG